MHPSTLLPRAASFAASCPPPLCAFFIALLPHAVGAPKVVKGGLTKEEAAKFKDVLEKAGAKVSIS